MKKLLLALITVTSLISLNAQEVNLKPTRFTFSIAGNAGGGVNKNYKLVAGGDFEMDVRLITGIKFTASVGYENFAFFYTNNIATLNDHASFFPLLGGVKLDLPAKFYAHGQLGYSASTMKKGVSYFTYAPSIGYTFIKNVDASVKYLGLSNDGKNIGGIIARVGYNF